MKKGLQNNCQVAFAANSLMNVSFKAMQQAGVSYDEWVHLMFETGCDFVEMWITDPASQSLLLKDRKSGFWNWWVFLWMEDDKTKISPQIYKQSYKKLKSGLVNKQSVYQDFEMFLKRKNILINEKV